MNTFQPNNSVFKRYSFLEIIRMFYFVFRTKIIFKNARIIRFPFDVRGRNYIQIGRNFTSGRYCRFEAYPLDGKSVVLKIGINVQVNDYVHITAMKNLVIGNNVLLASKIYISDCSHGSYAGDSNDTSPLIHPQERLYSASFVEIKDDAWIGESVSILPGVIIGKGSIIGANSVVTKSIPDYCIAVGNPAVVIKRYDFAINRWVKV